MRANFIVRDWLTVMTDRDVKRIGNGWNHSDKSGNRMAAFKPALCARQRAPRRRAPGSSAACPPTYPEILQSFPEVVDDPRGSRDGPNAAPSGPSRMRLRDDACNTRDAINCRAMTAT